MSQANLQRICEQALDEGSGVLGCAFVDLATSLPVASVVKPGSQLTSDAMTQLFAAGSEYFTGSSTEATGSADATPNADGVNAAPGGVRVIQTTTELTFLFMALVPGAERELLVLVTDRKASTLGLGWMAMRQAVDRASGAEAEPETSQERLGARASLRAQSPEPASQPSFANRKAAARRTIWDRREGRR